MSQDTHLSGKLAKEKVFEYRLQILTLEIGYIERAIARLDEMTQTTKQWAILVWTGSVSLILGQKTLMHYILFTSIIPLLFWIVDARWRYWLRQFSYRQKKISELINSSIFEESFSQQDFSRFAVLDPLGRGYRACPEFKSKHTFWKAFKTAETSLLYIGMFLLSVAIGTLFM